MDEAEAPTWYTYRTFWRGFGATLGLLVSIILWVGKDLVPGLDPAYPLFLAPTLGLISTNSGLAFLNAKIVVTGSTIEEVNVWGRRALKEDLRGVASHGRDGNGYWLEFGSRAELWINWRINDYEGLLTQIRRYLPTNNHEGSESEKV